MVEYLTVPECLRQNGYRHYCNAYKYLEKQMFKHALGSFAKAQKNYDKAEVLEIECFILQPMLDCLSKNVASTIMGVDYGVQEITGLYHYMEDEIMFGRIVYRDEMYKDG